MKNKIADEIRLKHIFDAIESIESFMSNSDFDKFLSNKMLQSACIHQLEIIGEAANHFSKEFFEQYNFVEWAEIVGLRNLLIHEYFGIDLRIVWQVIQSDIPKLKNNINKIFYDLNI
jgi:uncharacterized protein with HEPN domain